MGFYALVKPLDLPEPETTSPVVAHLPLMRGLEALAYHVPRYNLGSSKSILQD